MSTILYKVV